MGKNSHSMTKLLQEQFSLGLPTFPIFCWKMLLSSNPSLTWSLRGFKLLPTFLLLESSGMLHLLPTLHLQKLQIWKHWPHPTADFLPQPGITFANHMTPWQHFKIYMKLTS
jgi:hypothetical protein